MNMKKIIAGIMTLCVMGGVLSSVALTSDNAVITASASDYTEGTYERLQYENYGDHIEISGCYNYTKEVEIPFEIDGIPVTSIGDNAFEYHALTSVTISDSVTNIGKSAFYGCTLTSIKIPDSVTYIGMNAFAHSGLKSIEIPNSVLAIGGNAFQGCENLKSIELPDSITSINQYTFSDCPSLKSITIPESVENINIFAFRSCYLTSIMILNPECEIWNSRETISTGGYGAYDSYYGTIYGYENSTAQAYAENYGYKFELLLETGDIDGNDMIDATDASFVLAEYAVLSTSGTGTFTEAMNKSADINGDSKIDSVDASAILGYYAYTSTGGTDTIEKYLETSDI